MALRNRETAAFRELACKKIVHYKDDPSSSKAVGWGGEVRQEGLTLGMYDSQCRTVKTPSKSSQTVEWVTPLLCMIWMPPSWLLEVYTSRPRT